MIIDMDLNENQKHEKEVQIKEKARPQEDEICATLKLDNFDQSSYSDYNSNLNGPIQNMFFNR